MIEDVKRIAEASFKAGWYSREIKPNFNKAFEAWKKRVLENNAKELSKCIKCGRASDIVCIRTSGLCQICEPKPKESINSTSTPL